MNSLSLKLKMAIIFSIMIASAVTISVLGIKKFAIVNGQLNNIADVTAQRLYLAQAINTNVFDYVRQSKNMILATKDDDMDMYDKKMDKASATIKGLCDDYRKVADDSGKQMLADFETNWNKYLELNKKICDYTRKNSNVKATALSQKEARQAFDAMKAPLQGLEEKFQARLENALTSASMNNEAILARNIVSSARIEALLAQAQRDEKNMILDTTEEGMKKYQQNIENLLAEANKEFTQLKSQADQDGKLALDEFQKRYEAWLALDKQIQQLTIENGNTIAFDLSTNQGRPIVNACEEQLAALVDKNQKNLDETQTTSNNVYNSTRNLMIGVSIISIILSLVLGTFITRGITQSLKDIFKGLKDFSSKELHETAQRFKQVIDGLNQGAEQVAAASHQVSQSSQQMAEGASEQASSLEEISSSLEEMASMTRQNADNTKTANTMTREAMNATTKSRNAMARMSEAINQIKASSDQTAKIVKTIDEIAFQTNLLALNAAVEAARAGEAGKGFAVVAEEVRNLAQRSAEAAKTTASLIEESQKNSENGVNATSEVEEILKTIADDVQKMTELIDEVASASEEQAKGIDQVNLAVAQMDKVTQSNAANSEESASASEELSAQANELKDIVGVLISIVEDRNEATSPLHKNLSTGARHNLTAPKTHQAIQLHGQGHVTHHARQISHSTNGSHGTHGLVSVSAERNRRSPETVIPLEEDEFKEF